MDRSREFTEAYMSPPARAMDCYAAVETARSEGAKYPSLEDVFDFTADPKALADTPGDFTRSDAPYDGTVGKYNQSETRPFQGLMTVEAGWEAVDRALKKFGGADWLADVVCECHPSFGRYAKGHPDLDAALLSYADKAFGTERYSAKKRLSRSLRTVYGSLRAAVWRELRNE